MEHRSDTAEIDLSILVYLCSRAFFCNVRITCTGDFLMAWIWTIKLPYDKNDFSLEFSALNFINPENNQYKYKLEPYENLWIETPANNRVARYTNIDPGRYIFRVIGSNNDGIWNEQGASLVIIIAPPWWQTWWAYILYFFLTGRI